MTNPRATRERKADRKSPADAATEPEATAVPSDPTPADPGASKLEPAYTPAPKLANDDLMALASMSPEELAELMDGAVTSTMLEAGAKVTGVITRVGDQTLLVDVGGKAEAWLERSELPEAVVGDQVTAFVLHVGDESVRLSTQLTGDAAGAFLEEAMAGGIPVEGHVASANSGGFEVRVGSVRAFCPRSLMSRHHIDEPSVFVGQTLQFKVIETGEKNVLSRRALEEERAEEFAGELWGRVEEGQTLEGVVRNVQSFGAFVDLGGVDGLIPRSELSWSPGASTSESVSIGETVSVRVIKVDRDSRKLTLSLKSPEGEPWRRVGSEFIEGGVYTGTVARITTFGAFVKLSDGLDGLIHVSKLSKGAPAVGDSIQVRVLAVDAERQRLSLAPAGDTESTDAPAAEQEQVSGTVAEVMTNGVVVKLDDGRNGWLPASEVDLPAGTLLAQRYRRGRPVSARVIDASRSNRITLSTRTQTDDSWRQAAKENSKKQEGSFGTFGDLFAGLKLK